MRLHAHRRQPAAQYSVGCLVVCHDANIGMIPFVAASRGGQITDAIRLAMRHVAHSFADATSTRG
jgi:hypothetical protein